MTLTAARGFTAAGVAAGIEAGGGPDLALVVNTGPSLAAAGVVTTNRVKAAPVLWTAQVLTGGRVSAAVLHSGGANACTGPAGFQDTHATAERAAAVLGHSAGEVAVASAGRIGVRPPMDALLPGVDAAAAALSPDGGERAAIAITTTDSAPRAAAVSRDGWTVGGMAMGAGMPAPGLATVLAVLTTDADLGAAELDRALRGATRVTLDRIDSAGRMSPNDTVLLLASGASGVAPPFDAFEEAVHAVCEDLGRQLLRDAEGATKDIRVEVVGAASEADAVEVGRAIARDHLLRRAVHGEDPDWGRVPSAIGTTSADFEPNRLGVAINGVWVCRDGSPGEDRERVAMSAREVRITADLAAGRESAVIWTNDLTAAHAHEHRAYST